ncbi:hypothetical protein BDA96_05G060900 [Sorghum bicolor]|jgi:hypothetical protein|uniref:Uncharacterized protein n=1 Tax=Sorghum bicolor TaxID=4558 RepID=A0A921UEX3_SORBI|nr:hypothetical protein BDA96_05G060900 [Sorghum bicolor]
MKNLPLGDTLSDNVYMSEANSIPIKDTKPKYIAMPIDRHDAAKFCIFGLKDKLWQSADNASTDLLYFHLFHMNNLLFFTRQQKILLYHKANLHLFVKWWNQ